MQKPGGHYTNSYRIPSVCYVANGNTTGEENGREPTELVTTGQATAQMYRDREGYQIIPIGPFIDASNIHVQKRFRKNFLFVNPVIAKGAHIVAAIAFLLEEKRPDIQFEVVESRGEWSEVVEATTGKLGDKRQALQNVKVTKHTTDMRPIYKRTRVLLMPSLWWESFGRVAVEATLNGIPVVGTNRGGIPEAAGTGGIYVNFPTACYQKPFPMPDTEALRPLATLIERLQDDQEYYDQLSRKAKVEGKNHDIEKSTDRLEDVLLGCISHYSERKL